MKTNNIILSIVAFSVFPLFAEEIYLPSLAEYRHVIPSPISTIGLVKHSQIAGVGRFMNQLSKTNKLVTIYVDDCWTGDITNNMLTVSMYSSNNEIPTNTPVVFFAMMSDFYLEEMTGHYSIPDPSSSFDYTPYWILPEGDRAWFRTTRDNGLLYDFTTNLWDCLRTNPNSTNYYHTLLSARKLSFDDSRRIHYDSFIPFTNLIESKTFTPEFLIDEWQNPNMPQSPKQWIARALFVRGWTLSNGVWSPPQ